MDERPYTPETLADRWACSTETIRQLVKSGRLPGFRVGRMFRIPAAAVEEYERDAGASPRPGGASHLPGPTAEAGTEGIILKHSRERRPKHD